VSIAIYLQSALASSSLPEISLFRRWKCVCIFNNFLNKLSKQLYQASALFDSKFDGVGCAEAAPSDKRKQFEDDFAREDVKCVLLYVYFSMLEQSKC
jgi:hypothetical protein